MDLDISIRVQSSLVIQKKRKNFFFSSAFQKFHPHLFIFYLLKQTAKQKQKKSKKKQSKKNKAGQKKLKLKLNVD